jgi:hypothetical protein
MLLTSVSVEPYLLLLARLCFNVLRSPTEVVEILLSSKIYE